MTSARPAAPAVFRSLADRVASAAGGPARRRVVVLFALTLALDGADAAAVGAVAGELKPALGLDNAQIGLLATATALVGAAATIPIGLLVDRRRRVTILAVSVALWSAAMIATGAAHSYQALLVSRLALGAVMATSGPAIPSLVGDFIAPGERGRIYGLILSGELLGGGLGFVVGGDLAGLLSWRWGFWWLAVPGLLLAVAIARLLPEPERGGGSWLPRGAKDFATAPRAAGGAAGRTARGREEREVTPDAVARSHGIPTHEDRVLASDPARMSLVRAIRYVLRVRTNVWLIVASAVGYFFFGGLRTFAVLYVRERFDLSQAAATSLLLVMGLGSLVGVLLAGRLSDRLVARGRVDARIVVAGWAYVAACALFVPGIAAGVLAIIVPLNFIAAAALSAANPPLDAARLDVLPAQLWGRGEAVRTVARQLLVGFAPLTFGWVSQQFGGPGESATVRGSNAGVEASTGQGLEIAFLVLLSSLLVAGLVLLLGARRSYPRDAATAAASTAAIERARRGE